MTVQEDVEKILQAGQIIEDMEGTYEPMLKMFGKDVHLRHPGGLSHCGYTPHSGIYDLMPGDTTPERISFRDDDGDFYYLPTLWVEDRDAWWAQALNAEAEYKKKEAADLANRRIAQIVEFKRQLARLEEQA